MPDPIPALAAGRRTLADGVGAPIGALVGERVRVTVEAELVGCRQGDLVTTSSRIAANEATHIERAFAGGRRPWPFSRVTSWLLVWLLASAGLLYAVVGLLLVVSDAT